MVEQVEEMMRRLPPMDTEIAAVRLRAVTIEGEEYVIAADPPGGRGFLGQGIAAAMDEMDRVASGVAWLPVGIEWQQLGRSA